MSSRLRIGVVGGGLIAQVVHLPNLRQLNEQFNIVAIADPSPAVAYGLAERYPTAQPYTNWRDLIDLGHQDALLVCSPHHTHAEITLAALDRGIHVLVEKPLCIDPEDARIICRRSHEHGLVVQVGYMKRYEGAYEGFLETLPASIESLRLISVTTYDPSLGREPFVHAAELISARDIPEATLDIGRVSEREQVARAIGQSDPRSVRAFSHTFLGCLIHDINLVHGALDRMGVDEPLTPRCAEHWADGDGASIMVTLPNGGACNCAWILLPGVDAFREHAAFYFTDSIHELTFPAPYDPTGAVRHSISGRRRGAQASDTDGGGFVSELQHFHSSITNGAPCRTPPEQAVRDLDLLRAAFLTTTHDKAKPDHRPA